MNTNEQAEAAEIVAVIDAAAAGTEPVVENVKVPEITIPEIAQKIVEANPELVIHENEATGYKCLITAEKTAINWKKGLIWNVNKYSKGFNFEFQLYSSKKGAHLVEFVDKFKALATDSIKAEKMGLTIRLRIKLPLSLGEEEIIKKATEFIKLVEPVANEVRGILKDEDFVSKKETPKKEKKVEAPAEEKKSDEPVAEVPVTVETPAVEEKTAPVKTVQKASKKSKK